jgi:hypothetical protein
MFNDPKFFNIYVEKIPTRMKRQFVFYVLPYWEHLKISHLLDPMHILKNISSFLQRHVSPKKLKHWVLGDIFFLQILYNNISHKS